MLLLLLLLLSRDSVIWKRFGLVIGFIAHVQFVTTINYGAIANSRTLLNMAHAKSSMSLLGVAWQWIPTMFSASVFYGSGPRLVAPSHNSLYSLLSRAIDHALTAHGLYTLTAGSRLYCSAHGLLPADSLPRNSKLSTPPLTLTTLLSLHWRCLAAALDGGRSSDSGLTSWQAGDHLTPSSDC
jgi:hypothetical protein